MFKLGLRAPFNERRLTPPQLEKGPREQVVGQAVLPGAHFECTDPTPSLRSTMIVVNDKIPDARSVEPTLIQGIVLGDEGSSPCDGCSTYRATSHRRSQGDSHRPFASPPMDCHSSFPRQAPGERSNNNGRVSPSKFSAHHSTEGNQYSEGAEMKNHKRKLIQGEEKDINVPKFPRIAHNSSTRLENGHMRFLQGTEQQAGTESPLPGHKDPKGTEETRRVARDGSGQSKTSQREEQAGVNLAPQENPTKHYRNGKGESKLSCSGYEKRLVPNSLPGDDSASPHISKTMFRDHLEDLGRSPLLFPIQSINKPRAGNWRDTNRLFIGKEGQKMDILNDPLPSSFEFQGSHSSKFKSKELLDLVNRSDCNEPSAHKEGIAADALCKISTSDNGQKFSFQHPSPKANNADASSITLGSNRRDPSPLYNGSGVLESAWHPFYSAPVSSEISGPQHVSYVTAGAGSSTYSHLHAHFPHFLGGSLPVAHQSSLSSLLSLHPQLDSTYGSSLGPVASTYSCYHPKHLQTSSPPQLTAAYGPLSLYPTMWQNVNVDVHSGSRLSAARQGYVNGEPTFNLGFPNPWSYHQSQQNIADHQPEVGQYSSISSAKELAASSGPKANSTYVYKGDVNGTRMYGDFLHPFPHGLGKVEVQNVSCSKGGIQPIPAEQLYKEVSFKQDPDNDCLAEVHSSKRCNPRITAEARNEKPLSLVLRSEQKTQPGDPPLVSPSVRPTSNSKELSIPSSGFTLSNRSPDLSRKLGPTIQHQQLIVDENQRGLTLEETSLYSAVNGTNLQYPPFHRATETGPKVKDQSIRYQVPPTLLPFNSSDNKNNFGDVSHGHLEQKNDVLKVLASPLSLATSMETHHPNQLPLTMPLSKSPDATKTLTLDISDKDSNGSSKHEKLESEKANRLFGMHNKVFVHNPTAATSCLPAVETQITVVPQMELGGKIRHGTCSTIARGDNRHQGTNTDCNPSNEEHCPNSPTPMVRSQSLAEYSYNSSPSKGAVNPKRILQVNNAPDYYTPKKYKAARAATPCPTQVISDGLTSAGEMQAVNVNRDTSSPKVPLANASPAKPASVQDAFSASPSLQSNPHNYHTKLKKAWLTRHSEQDTMRDQQGSGVNGMAAGQTVSNGQGLEPAALVSNPKQPEENERALATKRNCDNERGDLLESRHRLRARREAKLTKGVSGQDVEENTMQNNKVKEEHDPIGTREVANENSNRQNDQSDAPCPKEAPKPMALKSSGECFLQDVPCTELFTNIPRCRDCWPSRSRKGQESPPLSCSCRFMNLRRLSIGRNGGLKVEGFSTEDQINEESPLESSTSARETGLDSDTSAYILAHVSDLFCDLMLSERGLLERIGQSYDGAIACKAANGKKEERCDSCHSVVFNLHWVCPRCGFLVCMDCYNTKQKRCTRNEKERGEDFTAWLKCAKGHNHDIKNLRPTQLVPNTALVSLCEKMHRGKDRLGIKSKCTCVVGDKSQFNNAAEVNKSPKPQTEAKVEGPNLLMSGTESTSGQSQGANSNHSCSQSPLHWLAELATIKAKEEANEAEDIPGNGPRRASSKSPANQESRAGEHCSTLCDLLTTTAGKLRLGSTDAGIAFAPVYTTLNSCNVTSRTMPSILDDIIASVVEKKIPIIKAVRQGTDDQPGKMCHDKEYDPVAMQGQERNSTLHYPWLAKGTFPWIQSPTDKNNWKFFQEYWMKGLPVLVSGVLTATDTNSWGPECLRQDLGEQSVSLVNCRDHSVLTRARSKEFWEGFKTNSNCHRLKGRSSKILRLDYCASEKEFSEQMPSQFDELHRQLPFPDYTRNDGKLNLVSRFPEETAKSQLELRVCSVYGLNLDDGDKGSTSLHLELTDTMHILVHVEPPKEEQDTLEKAVLGSFKEDAVDDVIMRRLRDPNERPGALWHIYTSQDTKRIKEFLQKVEKERDPEGQDQVLVQCGYLDQNLRARLLEESGIRGRAVLQFRGDAVLIPTATTYQVQYFSSCISVTKQFVSPEHVKHSLATRPLSRENKPLTQHAHKLQMKSILYNTVKDCVETLAATTLG